MAEQIDRIVLWRHPESEHARWLRLRMGDRTYRDLVAKQDAIVAGAQADGIEAVIVAASVDEMVEACRRLGVEPDQQGRSLAIVAIDAHKAGANAEGLPIFRWDADGRCLIRARLCDLADKTAWPRLGFHDRGAALDALEDCAQELVERLRNPQAQAYLTALDQMRATGAIKPVLAARDALFAVGGATPIEITIESDDPDDPEADHSFPEVRLVWPE